MKLLLTADTIGGVWTYAIQLCHSLWPYDVHIALATMGQKLSADQHRQVGEMPHVHLYESSYRLCWMHEPWDDVEKAGEWLLSITEDFQPDVIHLNDLAHGDLDWQAPVLLVGHSCVLSWWEAVKKTPAPEVEWSRYRRRVKKSVQQVSFLAAPSSAMLAASLHHYGPVSFYGVMNNGRDYPAMINSFGAAQKEEIVFAAGRLWDEAKNIILLAKIAEQLPWPVYAAGEQHDAERRNKNGKGIHYLGFLGPGKLEEWLFRSSVFVAPALYEPFGLSILEAARAGCALVLGDIPSLREIWGNAAVYVKPDNPENLQNILVQLFDNPEQRRTMAERAGHRALRYTGSKMAADYYSCYQSLLKKDYR